jgi:hypothetical protein
MAILAGRRRVGNWFLWSRVLVKGAGGGYRAAEMSIASRAVDAPSSRGNRIHRGERRSGRRGLARAHELGVDGEVDRLARHAELQQQHIPVEGEKIDHDAIDAIPEAARRPALLVFLEGSQLGAQRGWDRAARLDAERPQGALAFLGVALLRDRLGVLPREGEQLGCRDDRVGHRADPEGDVEGLLASAPRLVVRREAVRHSDVALRFPRGPRRGGEVDAVAAGDEFGDLRDIRNPQSHASHARTDRGDEVGLARRAEDPHRARRRLLERLEQHVRCALDHAVGVFDHHHAIAAHRRRELRACDELAHVVHLDDDALGAQHREIGMRAGGHLAPRRLVALGVSLAQKRRGERVGEVGAAGARRTGDEPRMGHRRVSDGGVAKARVGGGGAKDRDGLRLAGQFIPHGHSDKPKRSR